MHRRRPNQFQTVHNRTTTMDDLFDTPTRQAPIPTPQPLDDELWSVKVVRIKTGLSRATVYKYMALGLFPRQRHLGPGRIAWRATDVRHWINSRPE
jgi:prophage regulatory protein